ncbi:hypothetical protein D9M69_552510 [compost metagenome]
MSAGLVVKRSRTMPVELSTVPLITALSMLPLRSAEAVTTWALSARTAVICRLPGRRGAPGVRNVTPAMLNPALVVRQASRLMLGATPAG